VTANKFSMSLQSYALSIIAYSTRIQQFGAFI
jgi:hypothetical protein